MTTNVAWRQRRIPMAIGILAAAYLAWLFYRNANGLHEFGWVWMGKELERRPLLASTVVVIAIGTTLLGIALLRKNSQTAIILGWGILLLTLGLESRGLLVRSRDERMARSMVALRDLGNVAGALRNDKCELPEMLPKSLRASALARDGWGREVVYLRVAGDEAYLLSLGADGRQDVEVRQGMASSPEVPERGAVSNTFPQSDLGHDIVYKLSIKGYTGFIIHPEGVSSGESCIVLSAFGCLAY